MLLTPQPRPLTAMPHLTNTQLIVFDKDGVLLDLNATWLPVMVAICAYLAERSGGSITRNALLEAIGIEMTADTDHGIVREDGIFASDSFATMREVWQNLAPELKAVFDDIETWRHDIGAIRARVMTGNTVGKGRVAEELTRLKKMGVRLCVATNDSTESTMIGLGDLGIAGVFDGVICADSGFGRKPEASVLLEACRITGIAPEFGLMVGDTETDWLAWRAAGFGFFAVITDEAPTRPEFIPSADIVMRSIEGLGRVIRGEGAENLAYRPL